MQKRGYEGGGEKTWSAKSFASYPYPTPPAGLGIRKIGEPLALDCLKGRRDQADGLTRQPSYLQGPMQVLPLYDIVATAWHLQASDNSPKVFDVLCQQQSWVAVKTHKSSTSNLKFSACAKAAASPTSRNQECQHQWPGPNPQ